jgi:hypothetical protein
MHIIYMFQIAVLIPYDSTLIILHTSFDHFLFFQLLVNHFTSILAACCQYLQPIFCNVPSRRARFDSFTASYPPLCFSIKVLSIQVLSLLSEDYPSDIPLFPSLVATFLHSETYSGAR